MPTKTETTRDPYEAISGVVGDLGPMLQQQLGTEGTYYQGPAIAGFDRLQKDAMGQMAQYGQAPSGVEGALDNTLQQSLGQQRVGLGSGINAANQMTQGVGQGMNTLGATAAGANLYGNPYLDQTFNRQTQQATEAFNETVMPGIANQTQQAGGTPFDSSYQNAVGQAQRGLSRGLNEAATDVYAGNYQQERGRQLAAANQLVGAGQAGISGLGGLYGNVSADQARAMSGAGQWANLGQQRRNALLQAGGMRQGMEQAQMDEMRRKHDFYQNEPWKRMGMTAQMMGAYNPYIKSTQRTGGPGVYAGAVFSGMGAMGSLAGGFTGAGGGG